jgi:hypothetical protein
MMKLIKVSDRSALSPGLSFGLTDIGERGAST